MNTSQLEAYRDQLDKLRNRLSGEVEELVQEIDINRLATHEHDADTSEEINADIKISQNEANILADVKSAIERIESGTFGVCVDCGKKVPMARLNVIPYAAVCIGCEIIREAS